MKTALLVIGFIAVLVGLLWIGQGTGYVRWPASSFMIDARVWAWYGIALAVVGVALIIHARRRA
jgi:NhaP-type Na+/H+ or K+/H+ antiporter